MKDFKAVGTMVPVPEKLELFPSSDGHWLLIDSIDGSFRYICDMSLVKEALRPNSRFHAWAIPVKQRGRGSGSSVKDKVS